MIVLGIDPGIAIVGYSVVELLDANRHRLLQYGCITTSSKDSLPQRLTTIYEKLDEIIEEFHPQEVAIEELFFNKNVKTALTVAQARGVEVLICKLRGLALYEYTPLQIKQAITGYGRADKRQIQESIKMILNMTEIPKPDDAADAIAVALCHLFSHRFKNLYKMK